MRSWIKEEATCSPASLIVSSALPGSASEDDWFNRNREDCDDVECESALPLSVSHAPVGKIRENYNEEEISCTKRKEWELERSICDELVLFLEQKGGKVSTGNFVTFYNDCRESKHIINKAGGLKAFVRRYPKKLVMLTIRDGQKRRDVLATLRWAKDTQPSKLKRSESRAKPILH